MFFLVMIIWIVKNEEEVNFMKMLALSLFVVTYILLLSFPKIRAQIALISATAFVLFGIVPLDRIPTAIDWNVLLMISGTMGIVALFIKSKMPSLLADLIIEKTPNVKWSIVALSLFAGVISAFVDNVATVLMIAPVALTIAKKLKISPIPSIIAIAVSSNLQGAATLVGDTTSIMLGGYAGMDFMDFFMFHGKIGIFWAVEAGALASLLILLYIFRKENQPIHVTDRTVVEDFFPSVLLGGTIVLLICASFIPNKLAITNGLICITLLVIGLIRDYVQYHQFDDIVRVIKEIDYFTLCLLAGLFVVIAGMTEAGIVDDISRIFVSLSGDNLFLIYTLIVWASVFFSAFIDNIPYIATMLPVVAGIANIMGVQPYLLYYGLLIGATLGGNLTPIGASANITALGILQKDGNPASLKQFLKISIPFTLVAVTSGYLLIWFIWAF